ncbi:hypothetical protein NMG60_11024061 [Bertholletia excelsa]
MNVIGAKKSANAVGGKTARACDSCLRKRARWYCAADDAFLCQGCDSSVHSANQLASRHERIRIDSKASSNSTFNSKAAESSLPAWHQGFTRKPRTPRHPKLRANSLVPQLLPKDDEEDDDKIVNNPLLLVPEIGSEDGSPPEDEEQLLYRVPVFDPLETHLNLGIGDKGADFETLVGGDDEPVVFFNPTESGHEGACDLDNVQDMHGFQIPPDMDFEEFADDVKSLLGTPGLDEVCACGLEHLLEVDCREEETFKGEKVKIEQILDDSEVWQLDAALGLEAESPLLTVKEEQFNVATKVEAIMNKNECQLGGEVERKMLLRLNYGAVIAAWGGLSSPWTTGTRPDFNPNDCWPDFMGWSPGGSSHAWTGVGGHMRCNDEGREARVSRYREKRRTRLFSKKIRYEVRKLNAEKRPRMKGRFVKRASFPTGSAFPYLITK